MTPLRYETPRILTFLVTGGVCVITENMVGEAFGVILILCSVVTFIRAGIKTLMRRPP
ncbi:MAG: hypothetical protein ACW99G_01740 [Candidatus Thorarchaeota archaeon]|jgi:hypothetical protein